VDCKASNAQGKDVCNKYREVEECGCAVVEKKRGHVSLQINRSTLAPFCSLQQPR